MSRSPISQRSRLRLGGTGESCSCSSTSGVKQSWDFGAWDLGAQDFGMHRSGARAAGGVQSPPGDRPLWGDHWGKAVPLPSSVWAWGRGTGRKFPICSAPILASPFVSLAICPAAPRAPRSRCTCRKYQDGLCLCFKRQRGPRAPALPRPPALPSGGCCQP